MSDTETYALGAFLARWTDAARHDLTASDSESLSLAALLDLADPDDLERWNGLVLGYAHPRGSPWLRAAIARRHDTLDPDDVVCCAGAQEAVACVARALLGPDDHAIVVLPIYPPSEEAVTTLCAATGVPLAHADDWQLDVDRIAAAIRPNTKLVLANFPNSPTGAAIDVERLGALVALCRRHGLWLMNDEVYRQTACHEAGDAPPMVADVYERGVSVNGLSKGFGLPGLRVGWAACRDREVLDRTLRAKSVLSSCLAATSEVLAHVALKAETRIVEGRREVGRRNHLRLRECMSRHPGVFEAEPPRNLAFAFPRYLGPDGADRFVATLIRETGILVPPSSLWDSRLAPVPHDRVRIGLGHSRNQEALTRLDQYLAGERVEAVPAV